MCWSVDKSDWKITQRFSASSFGVIMLKSILILKFGILTCFGLKSRYSVLFGLLLQTIQENLSLMHDSIIEKIEVRSGEKVKYIWMSAA